MPNPLKSSDCSSGETDLVVRAKCVCPPEGDRAAAIHIRGGVIAKISGFDDVPSGKRIFEAHNLAVMPGLADTHVHINEPGRTEWEGFATATRAAAAGGVTTLMDMPLNCLPPTTTREALREKAQAAAGRLFVEVGFLRRL